MPEYYDSIDFLPTYNYFKLLETQEPKYLAIDLESEKIDLKKALCAWEKIERQIIELQLKDPSFVFRLKSEARIYIRMAKGFLGSAYDMTIYKQEEKKLKEEGGQTEYNQLIMAIERYTGRYIDDKKLPVSRFYAYLNFIRDGAKKNR